MKYISTSNFRKGMVAISLIAVSATIQSAEIDEIVGTARAIEESVRDIPVAITAVFEERLDRFALEGFMDHGHATETGTHYNGIDGC